MIKNKNSNTTKKRCFVLKKECINALKIVHITSATISTISTLACHWFTTSLLVYLIDTGSAATACCG